MNHQQRLITALAGPLFVLGLLAIAGGVVARKPAWLGFGWGACVAAVIYAFIHWYR